MKAIATFFMLLGLLAICSWFDGTVSLGTHLVLSGLGVFCIALALQFWKFGKEDQSNI